MSKLVAVTAAFVEAGTLVDLLQRSAAALAVVGYDAVATLRESHGRPLYAVRGKAPT